LNEKYSFHYKEILLNILYIILISIRFFKTDVIFEIMNDLSFVPAEHAQAEDRAYRYGQKNNVLVYYPIFENTIEGVIYDILNTKKKIIGTVMGDQVSDSVDVVEEILSLINKRN
jgi:SNF2 family DNA or RNA helicase